MKTLDEHNKECNAFYRRSDTQPRPNGIACPECGNELIDMAPHITLAGNPPQKDICCNHCNYRGYRVA